MIRQWLETLHQYAYRKAYDQGFDWAVGALLRKELTPAEIEGYCWGSSDPFDKGATAATNTACTTVILDNRSF